jgi:hypothetical protein
MTSGCCNCCNANHNGNFHQDHGSEKTLVVNGHEQYLTHYKLDQLEDTPITSQQLNSENWIGA